MTHKTKNTYKQSTALMTPERSSETTLNVGLLNDFY